MTDTPQRQRRSRAVLSCDDCRRRKLACDRELPCKRCIKGNIAATCTYSSADPTTHANDTVRIPAKRQRSSEPPQWDLEVGVDQPSLERAGKQVRPGRSIIERLNELDRQVKRLQQRHHHQEPGHERNLLASVDDCTEQKADQPTSEAGLLRGRHYATFFYGPSSSMANLAHFSDLRSFMKDIYQNSTAQRLAQDLKDVESRAYSKAPSHRVVKIRSLRDLFPDREHVDKLVETYLATFATTYSVVHVPTFRSAYDKFWDIETRHDLDIEAIILAMMACTICISTHEAPRYCHNGSSLYSKAVLWIMGCETWLKRQSNKHRTLASLQVRCMRLIALAITSHKRKEFYQEVQAHMAFMRSSGMHRDPAMAGNRCSQFEGEMRRRIWATSVELELQASIDKGIPSVLSGLEFDCAPPRNVDDTLLHADMQDLPESQPITDFTDSSYLHISAQSLDFRIDLCSLTNSLKSAPTFAQCLRYGEVIERYMNEIPAWGGSRAPQVSALLDMQIRQFLTILHTSRALKAESAASHEWRYATMVVLENSATLTRLHEDLVVSGNFALCCLNRNDYLRAALLVCHIAYHASGCKDDIMVQMAITTFDSCLDKALRLQNELVTRLGRGGHPYWYMSAACGLVSSQLSPSQAATYRLQAVDRVSKVFYKMLSLLDDPDEHSLASAVAFEDNAPAFPQLDATLSEPLSAKSFNDAGLQLDGFALGGSSDWMMDEFWFLDTAQPVTLDDQTHIMF